MSRNFAAFRRRHRVGPDTFRSRCPPSRCSSRTARYTDLARWIPMGSRCTPPRRCGRSAQAVGCQQRGSHEPRPNIPAWIETMSGCGGAFQRARRGIGNGRPSGDNQCAARCSSDRCRCRGCRPAAQCGPFRIQSQRWFDATLTSISSAHALPRSQPSTGMNPPSTDGPPLSARLGGAARNSRWTSSRRCSRPLGLTTRCRRVATARTCAHGVDAFPWDGQNETSLRLRLMADDTVRERSASRKVRARPQPRTWSGSCPS